ncbi:MAG: M4 family metallopeptidase [Candidatus Zixiibacteriota bacterium]
MTKSFVIILFCVLSWLIPGSNFNPVEAATVFSLEDARQNLTSYLENEGEVPTFIEGVMSVPVERGRETIAALSFFELNRLLYKMNSPVEELRPLYTRLDRLGMTHLRFRQYFQGVRVWGADLTVHFDDKNVLKTVTGTYLPYLKINTIPDLGEADAVAIAAKNLNCEPSELNLKESELVVFPWEGNNYLCRRLILAVSDSYARWEYFIDAHDGRVVYFYSRLLSANEIGSGIGTMGLLRSIIETNYNGVAYEMIDSTRQADNDVHGYGGAMPDGNAIITYRADSWLPGEMAADGDNYWDSLYQGAAVDAHVYAGLMYDWWLREFDRNSYDDLGTSLLNVVDFTSAGENIAFWDGERIVIGIPSTARRSLAACPEVIAHEWAHAITSYTSQLNYFKESGALNESFSDIMGASFEWAHDSLDTPDWTLGENSFLNDSASRHMADPHRYLDPDYFGIEDPYWRETESCTPSALNDYCGVHTNNGVGNKWFQLLSDGGTHYDVTVTGIGVANAVKIAYRANVFYWTAGADFKIAALGTVSAANDLDHGGEWAAQVENAWQAVGVTLPQPQLYFGYPDGVPDLLGRNLPDTFDIAVTGLFGGTPTPGSGWIHYAINDEPYDSLPLAEIGAGLFRANLPAIECDSVVKFYITIGESETGMTFTSDPLKPFLACPATESVIIFQDNFENDMGWSVDAGALRGNWVRGLLYGGGYRTDPVTDFDGSGRCYLTGVGGGDADVDNGTTSLISPAFDATSGDCEISYARWYANCYSHAPYSDIMQVYLSGDGGDSWFPVEEIGPVNQASGGWLVNRFYVSDFLSPTDNMKIRFDVSDLNDGSVVEAALDDFSVRTFKCRRYVCGDVNNNGSEPDISDITALITYLYLGGSAPEYPEAANVNGSPDGSVDITDITYLIRFIYMGGAPLMCN